MTTTDAWLSNESVAVTDGEHVWSHDRADFAAQLLAAFAATDGSPEAAFDVAWDAMAHVRLATSEPKRTAWAAEDVADLILAVWRDFRP